MDPIKVLKRAWEITWRYRALWIFGIILALTAGGVGGNGPQATFGGGNGDGGNGGFPPSGDFSMPEISPQVVATLIAVGVGLACVIVVLVVAATVARYVAETALIRMVDDYEETGEKRSVRQGFRLGWSRTAWRLFLINLLAGLPVALALLLLLLLGVAEFGLLSVTDSTSVRVIGTVATIGLAFLVILLTIVVAVVLSLLAHFFRRACALEELGVIGSIRQGFGVVRQHLKDVAIMWLIMIGVQIGLMIATLVAVILLFPAIILLIVVGGMLGGLPALLVWGLASLLFEGAVPWILAAAVGLPIFILVMMVPWLFLGGLIEVFKSSVWTLTYRELRALEGLETGGLPELSASGLA